MPDTIDQLVRLHAEQYGDKPMIIDPESRISYAGLDDSTRALAVASKRASARAPGSA